jgi:hypothetical protein
MQDYQQSKKGTCVLRAKRSAWLIHSCLGNAEYVTAKAGCTTDAKSVLCGMMTTTDPIIMVLMMERLIYAEGQINKAASPSCRPGGVKFVSTAGWQPPSGICSAHLDPSAAG